MIGAVVINAADIRVGVAIGNTGACLALDGRRGVDGGAVAKQVAIGGVVVGGTRRQRAYGARGHIRARCRGGGIVRAVERDPLVRCFQCVVIVTKRDIRLHVYGGRIGRVNHRRQITRGLAVAELYVHARCGEAIAVCVNLA